MSTGVVSVRLSSELKHRLEELGERTGRPVGFYIREAVEAQMAQMEWAYGIAATAEAARRGTEKTFTLDETLRDLGITGEDIERAAETYPEDGTSTALADRPDAS